MKWCFRIGGGHTHVRVFMNGAKCGDLCFRNEEFQEIRDGCARMEGVFISGGGLIIDFVEEQIPVTPY
jgi:hypothetical protein